MGNTSNNGLSLSKRVALHFVDQLVQRTLVASLSLHVLSTCAVIPLQQSMLLFPSCSSTLKIHPMTRENVVRNLDLMAERRW